MSLNGRSRHFAEPQQLGRFRSEADMSGRQDRRRRLRMTPKRHRPRYFDALHFAFKLGRQTKFYLASDLI